MSTYEIIGKIDALREWEALLAEATAEVEAIKDDLKRELEKKDVEELEAGQYIVRFVTVQSSRFDTKRFKQELGEQLYKSYCKEILSKRFTVCG